MPPVLGKEREYGCLSASRFPALARNRLFFVLGKRKMSKIPSRSGGIGLSNVKKRLELGYDKNDYKFNFNERDNKFFVELKLRV